MGNSTIPKLSPVLIGNLSAGYLQTGDLFVQVFPWMNPQVPMKVLVLVLSPTVNWTLHGSLAGDPPPAKCTKDKDDDLAPPMPNNYDADQWSLSSAEEGPSRMD